MTTTTYPDGSQLTSTALTDDQIQTALQHATCQMLGILDQPWNVSFTLTNGIADAGVSSLLNLYPGQVVACAGVPAGTILTGFGVGNRVILSAAATESGTFAGNVTDPAAPAKVRIGWQKQGQPGWGIDDDTCIIRCTTVDSDFGRMRDITRTAGATTITETDVFTRAWRTFWTFYGPNSLNRARAARSALAKIPFIDDLLAQNNLYVDPSISEPLRVPEEFQGEWWERVDLFALFNEEITETFVVNAVASVEIIGSTEAGPFTDFTVSLP
jgi:hypothetical protein